MKPVFLTAVLLLMIAVILIVVELIGHMGSVIHQSRLISPEVLTSFVALSLVVLIVFLFRKSLTINQRVFLGSVALAIVLSIIGDMSDLKYPADLILMVMSILSLLVGLAPIIRQSKRRNRKEANNFRNQ